MFPLDPFEAMFDLDNNGILDETERATMYMFMQEQEAQEREKSD